MPGYPKEIFCEPKPSELYVCLHCAQVVKDPKQTACGHRICLSCSLDERLHGGTYECSLCIASDGVVHFITQDEMYMDYAAKRDLNKCNVRCQNHCDWTGILADYEAHFNAESQTLRLPQEPNISERREVSPEYDNESESLMNQLEIQHTLLRDREERLRMRLVEIFLQVMNLGEECTAMAQQRRRDAERIESLQRQSREQDERNALQDEALAQQDLYMLSLEQVSYDGILVWNVSDIRKKRQDAISGRTTSIYSPCFFTSRYGYKMCARLYLNGDGMGKGTYMSLFLAIMKGPFDALLKWPFRQKVTFMLLDQNNREHIIDAFRPDPTSSSFKRPTSNMNIASGCPLFMPISQVDSTHHAYVKDDAMFIKVIVDTSDLA